MKWFQKFKTYSIASLQNFHCFLIVTVLATIQMSKANPKTLQDFEDFAYALGEHAQSFSNDVQYKQFVQDLLQDLMKDLTPDERKKVLEHIDKLSKERAKEGKNAKHEHFLKSKKDTSDEDDADSDGYEDGPNDLYSDFMWNKN